MLLGSRSLPGSAEAGVQPGQTAAGFDGLLDALPGAVFQLGSDGIVRAARLGPSGDADTEASAAFVGLHVSEVLGPDATRLVLAAVDETLATGHVVSRIWETGSAEDGNRSSREGIFSRSAPDAVLAISRDVTAERSRLDADRFVLDLGRRLIAESIPNLEAAVSDGLRRTASFVGGRGALLLVPEAATPHDLTVASAWTPMRMPAAPPTPDPGKRSWLVRFVEGLERPTIVDADALPVEAPIARQIVRDYELAAVGLIPTVCDFGRLGAVAIGFPSPPDLVSRLRLGALGPLGHLLTGARERHQREAQRWVQDAEDRFRDLARHAADIILVLDENRRLVFASTSMRDLLGYEPDELIGRDSFELVHPDDRAQATDRFGELASGRAAEDGRIFRVRHRDGSWRVFSGIVTDQRDDPTVGGFVAVARDVTDRLAAEEALRGSEQRFREARRACQ